MSVERTATFLGRTLTYGYVVTAHQLDRPAELKVDRAFPMLVRCEVDDAPDGTRVAIHATGTPGGFFRWVTHNDDAAAVVAMRSNPSGQDHQPKP